MLQPGAAVGEDPGLPPFGCRPDTQHIVAFSQARDRDLDHEAVDVVAISGVDPGGIRLGHQMKAVERPQSAQIEDRSEVDREGLVPLSGEDPDTGVTHAVVRPPPPIRHMKLPCWCCGSRH